MNKILISIFLLAFTAEGLAQKNNDVYVDKNGVMRWGNSKEEVYGFGVNYTAMFAHAYRTAKRQNISLEKAIDNDVYHFARLGFDAYRVHVWDCEISDTVGNLLSNDHLRLFDYALAKMKERGMKFIITPIAYWGNGWPEPDEKTPGFASKYGKGDCLTNEGAIKAQEKYLFQFLNHVNQYTGVAYKNDPTILAFEISNEPHHNEAPEKVTTFINRMVTSMRNTGCKKPIFYNISHSIHLADAYFKASIQGGTFQWYPTGLGSRHELGGNLLTNVDLYTIPFANDPKFKKMAKIVYEFDAADVGRSYIYPAMARSFRETGIQVATHFAYDPTFMADVNTEYGTHYMNLVYAPQKALSLKIASAVFHRVPMYKNFGGYPTNTTFGDFRVSYEQDLAEMNTEKEFYYTNTTTTKPISPDKLEHIAGSENSTIINYEGTGAYFLDRLESGVWRLEVMPDAIWVVDPFERTSPKKEVAVIHWRMWPMSVNLSDLGDNYSITALNEGNSFTGEANGKSFQVSPGTYLLQGKGVSTKLTATSRWENIVLKEFSAPATSVKKTYVIHKPVSEISADVPYTVEATIVSVNEPLVVEANVFSDGRRPEVIELKKVSGYTYRAVVPEKLIKEGFLKYFISVKEDTQTHTYPSGVVGSPRDWDFYDTQPYQIRVVQKTSPLYLFNAATDNDELSRQWVRTSTLVPTSEVGQAELLVNIEKLFVADPENKKGSKISDYSMRYSFGKKVSGRNQDLTAMKEIVFKGRSLNEKPCKIQLALIMKDGSAFGGTLTVNTAKQDYRLPLTSLKPVNLVTLPRPYPTFLSYYFKTTATEAFNPEAIESLQISIGPGLSNDELQQKQGFAIESVRLE